MDTIADLLPIILHEAAVGVDCCGCMVARARGVTVELVCSECGIVEGTIDGAILAGSGDIGIGLVAPAP